VAGEKSVTYTHGVTGVRVSVREDKVLGSDWSQDKKQPAKSGK
jgi:hypothetical protein